MKTLIALCLSVVFAGSTWASNVRMTGFNRLEAPKGGIGCQVARSNAEKDLQKKCQSSARSARLVSKSKADCSCEEINRNFETCTATISGVCKK